MMDLSTVLLNLRCLWCKLK